MVRSFKLLFIISLFFVPFGLKALPTFISGKVIQGKGLVIRVLTYSDRISFQEQILDQDEIDANGAFDLGFEINEIQELSLRIGNQEFSFYAESGKSYDLEISHVDIPPKSAINEQQPLHLLWSEPNNLDEAIGNFSYAYSSFLEENFVALYKFRDAELLKSFEKDILKKLAETNTLNPLEKTFFDNYVNYQLAELKNASKTVTTQYLGETYFKNKEVLYNHPSYMLFFNNYFQKYFETAKRNTNYHEFIALIQHKASVKKLLDYMGKDPILIQERLRELVLLSALKEVYYNSSFSDLQIKLLIEEISKQSKFPEHNKIGAAILTQLTNMQIGNPAPPFNLKTTQGNQKKLDDYKGRYVYLVFVSDNCPACDSDMLSLNQLQEKYKENVAVVGLLVNYTQEGLNKFTEQENSNWDRLLFDSNFKLLNDYRIRTFPLFILLDKAGNILLNPAKKPHEGIDRYFDYLIKRDEIKGEKPDILFR